eukprot:scaffold56_cov390-Pavlova_lutheri.AAC.4
MADEDGSSGSSGLRGRKQRVNFENANACRGSNPIRNDQWNGSGFRAGHPSITHGYGVEYIRGKGGVAKYRDCAYSDCVRKPS